MKYFNSAKINVYPAGFRSDKYKQSKLTTEENITHLQNFIATSDGLYIDPVSYTKPGGQTIIELCNNGKFYKENSNYLVSYPGSSKAADISNDYFIIRVCGYSFRCAIKDFLDLITDNDFKKNGIYAYIYLRYTDNNAIGSVLGIVDKNITDSNNVIDQQDYFYGLGIGLHNDSNAKTLTPESEDKLVKVLLGKFSDDSKFKIQYNPVNSVNATADESGNNIKSTYGASIDSANGNTIILKNKNDVEISHATLTNIAHAEAAKNLDRRPSLSKIENKDTGISTITVTAGEKTSEPFTVPYAMKATGDGSGADIEETYGTSLSASNATITLNNKDGGELKSVTVNNVQNSKNSSYASKIKTSKAIGGINNPVYIADDGTVTAGKSIPKLNGSDQDTAISFYAPTSAGKVGHVLKSKGSGAPDWIDQSELSVGSATKASEDANGNTITSTYAHSLTTTDATHTIDAKICLKANGDTTLSNFSLNTVKNSIISEIKNGRLEITKIDDVKIDDVDYNVYTADLYGLNRLEPGTFLTVYLAANNVSDKRVKFKLNTSQNENDSLEKEVYLNGKVCSSANKLGLDNWGKFYNAYYTGTEWNFTSIGEIISGTSVTLNGNDKQGKYINIYAPDEAGTKGAILLSDGDGLNKAPVWSNTSKGSSGIKPLYLDSKGVLSVGSQYAGGTKVTLNGAGKGSIDANIYAAERAQDTDKNKVLKCNGKNKEPSWIAQSDLSVGEATNANKIRVEADSGVGTTGYKSIKSVTSLPTSPDSDTLYIVVEA